MPSPYRDPGRNLKPGDESRRHGDYVGFDAAIVDDAASPGQPVTVNDGNIAIAGEGDKIFGYVSVDEETQTSGDNLGTYSNRVTIKVHGTGMARVQPDTVQGQALGSPNTSATTPEDGGALGTFDDQDFVALEDAQSYDLDDGTTVYIADVMKL